MGSSAMRLRPGEAALRALGAYTVPQSQSSKLNTLLNVQFTHRSACGQNALLERKKTKDLKKRTSNLMKMVSGERIVLEKNGEINF